MNIYTDNGFENREHYLQDLADELDLDLESVLALAEVLGEEEDFDGLVTTLQDFAQGF